MVEVRERAASRRIPRPRWLRISRSAWWRRAAVLGELLVLAVLLAADFELGVRLLPADPDAEAVIGALATALVAFIAALLALLRRVLPPRAVVAIIVTLSLSASVLAAVTGVLTATLTETVAVLVAAVVGIRAASSVRGAVLVGGATLAAVLAAILVRLEPQVSTALLGVIIWGCAVAAGIAARHVRLRRELALEDARRVERMELARELHDVIAHQVTGIVVQAQAAIAVSRRDPARAAEALTAIEAAGAEALSGMRRMVGAIRDDAAQDSPLTVPYRLADIETLVDSFDPGRQRTALRLEATDASLPAGLGESAYRIVREALTNVRRHAPGARTRIDVHTEGEDLLLEICNDGVRGPAVAPDGEGSRGFGITGMRERVAQLGGSFHAGPQEPGTWSVRARLPRGTTT